jgi:hypothetical protein
MANPRSNAEILQEVVAAGRAALRHLSRVAPKLRGIVLPTVVEAVVAASGFTPQTRAALNQIQRDLTLARSRSRVFWQGIQSLLPRVDAEQELQPLNSIADELARITAVHGGSRLGPLGEQLESYRERLKDLLTRLQEEPV